MKIGVIITVFVFFFLFFGSTKSSYSQNCERKRFCLENFGERYIYNTQSRYGTLPMGEKKRIKTSCYSNKRYRVFVCCDPDFGEITYKVIKQVRKNVRKIKQIRKDTIISYKLDEWGEIVYLEENDYEPEEIGKEIVTDTIWETARIVEEKILFNSKSNTSEKNYWEASIKRGHSIIIEVTAPPGDPDIEGCVNIYIGSRSLSSKRFGTTGKQSLHY